MFVKFINTPLGKMVAKSDEHAVLALDFAEKFNDEFMEYSNEILEHLASELDEYFAGKRKDFSVPLKFQGTDFQINAWKTLQKIPFGTTISYVEQATLAGNKKAVRAVAAANSKNKILLIVPCHRVIGSNGTLKGFSSGLWRKKALLELENSLTQ
jgi:O-6-methylguanine DNA methyltransferase